MNATVTEPQHFREVSWRSVRSSIGDSALCRVLDRVAKGLGPSATLVEGSYRYGSLLVNQGVLRPPCDKEVGLAAEESKRRRDEVCQRCAGALDRLAYSPIPFGLVMDNSVEVFTFDEVLRRVKAYALLRPQSPFGVFEVLNQLIDTHSPLEPTWSLSAGARSVVILAPFNNKRDLTHYAKRLLPNLEVTLDPVFRWLQNTWFEADNWTSNSWEFVCQLAVNLGWTWSTRVLLFPEEWIGVRSWKDWHSDLRHHLLAVGWSQSALLRQYATEEQRLRKLWNDAPGVQGAFPDANLGYHILRDIITIGRGAAPALAPSVHPTSTGPFKQFQDLLAPVFMAVKGLRPAFPVVLEPTYLDAAGRVGYYELRQPLGTGSQAVKAVEPVNSALRYIHDENPELIAGLDFESRLFFCRSPAVRAHDGRIMNADKMKEALDEQFLPPDEKKGKVYRKAPFLTASVRLVRK